MTVVATGLSGAPKRRTFIAEDEPITGRPSPRSDDPLEPPSFLTRPLKPAAPPAPCNRLLPGAGGGCANATSRQGGSLQPASDKQRYRRDLSCAGAFPASNRLLLAWEAAAAPRGGDGARGRTACAALRRPERERLDREVARQSGEGDVLRRVVDDHRRCDRRGEGERERTVADRLAQARERRPVSDASATRPSAVMTPVDAFSVTRSQDRVTRSQRSPASPSARPRSARVTWLDTPSTASSAEQAEHEQRRRPPRRARRRACRRRPAARRARRSRPPSTIAPPPSAPKRLPAIVRNASPAIPAASAGRRRSSAAPTSAGISRNVSSRFEIP